MRTYTRKKPEYQYITGVEELCRLCLGNTGCSVPLFTGDSIENDSVCALPLRIMICVGLEMTREECLPKTICNKCYKELERCYTFRKKCEVTYQKLKSHVLAVKEKEQQQALELKCKQNKVEIPPSVNGVENPNQMQHLVLTINENKQMELVNVINIKPPEYEQVQQINGFANDIARQTVQIEENIDVQDTTPTVEIEASNSDMSMILSTILMELDVLQAYGDRLIVVDSSLKTVEIEGGNNSKIVLELLEEEDTATIINTEELVQNNVENTVISNNALSNIVISNNETIKEKKIESIVEVKDKSKQCQRCMRVFASRSALVRHGRVHSGERPHACATCGRRFGQREVMLRHQLVHTEVRPFKCAQCPKSFTQRGALEQHARAHSPRRPRALALHRCTHCRKVFLHASGLSRHLSVHSGKVFVCNGCGYQFRDKSSLLRHLRAAHTAPNA